MAKLTLDNMFNTLSGADAPQLTVSQVMVADGDMPGIGVRRNQVAETHLLWCATVTKNGVDVKFYAHKIQDCLRKAVEAGVGAK